MIDEKRYLTGINLDDIPIHFRAGYLAREREFTQEETSLFYSFSDNDPRKEAARNLVLAKREMFYALWSYESDTQHMRESEEVKIKPKTPSVKDILKEYFLPITFLVNKIKGK